ncbi:tandem-95 repeat protein [bacterium]|nr:MAG: tandem-95 repeat protein [bacterium]
MVGIFDSVYVSSGTLTFSTVDTVRINRLQLSGGTLTGSAPVWINTVWNWSSGTLSGSDSTVTLVIAPGAGLNVSSGSAKTMSRRTVVNYGTMMHTGTSFTYTNGAVFDNKPPGVIDLAGSNSGFSYSAGTSKPRIKNSGLLKKSAGTASTIAIVVENTDGRIEVHTTSLTLSDTTKWTNSVDTVFAGATMIFSGGTATKHVFDSGSRLAGYGNVTFSNGTATLSGTYDILGVSTFTGDTVKLNGAGGSIQSLGDSVSVTGGTVTITAPDNIQLRTLRQSAGTFNVSTGDSIIVTTLNLTNGTLGGTAPIYVNSKFVLNGGTVVSTDSSTTITVPVGATFYWSGNGTFQRRTFNNYGTAIWTSPWGLDMNAVYNNMPGALTDWTVDGNTNWFGGTSNNFNNYGTLRKSGGTGISSFEYYVNNYGLIEVQSGTLYFGASGTHAGGGFVLSPGSTIDFAAGNHTFDASSNVTGTGTVLISPTTFAMDGIYNIIGNTTIGGGTINFDSTFSTTNRTTINGGTTNFRMMPGHFLGAGNRLNVAGGTVNFVTTDSLKVDTLLVNGTVSGNNHWYVRNYLQLTAGTMASPNRALSLTLPAGSTFNWSGNGTVSQRTVFNYGTANWSSPWGFSDSTVYNNMAGAVTNLTTDYNSNWFFATGEPYLINYGTLNKSGGTGISSFEYQISNYGTMQVDSGLTILCYDSLVNFSGGIITGKGTLDVSTRFTNAGTIRPGTSPGKLRVTGNLKNTSTAIYDAEIGGKNLGQFDELRASGSATLAGILNVSLIDGYLPALNDTVKVLNYSSKTGAFGEINGLRTGGPYDFVPLYKDTALFLIASDSLNSEPIASTDFLSAPEDVETHLPVLRNDVDSNSDALSIVEILPGYPQNGTAYIGSPDTTIVYTSPLNYFGKDTLRYVIYDGRGGWDTAGVSISVTPVNDAPSPKDTFAIADQFGIARINVIATATDVEGSSLFASTASKPKYGEAHVDGNDSFVVYVPPVYFTGVDSFKFYVSDGGAVDSATIVVTVTAGDSFLVTRSNFNTNDEGWNTFNDVSDSAFLSTGGNPGGFFYAVDAVTGAWWYFNAPSKFLGDLSSTYNKTLRFDMKQKPAGTDNSQPDVILIGNGVQLNYDFPSNPRTNFTGFGLILNETTGWKKQTTGLAPSQLEMQTVLANVTTLRIRGEFTAGADSAGIDNIILAKIPDNSSPVANTDNASTNEEVSLQVSPLANDTDAESQSLTITAVSSALNGTATIDVGNLTITYKPDSNFAGLDSFAYYITDGYGGQDSAYIRVTVNNINDAPVVAAAIPDTSFNEDFGKSFLAMMPNVFNDVDNGPTYGASNLSAGVTPLISNDSLYLLSSALFAGNVDIRVTAFDGEYTVADTFTVTVSSVNQAPVVAIPFRDTTLAEDFAKTFLSRLTQNFTDPNLDTLFFNVSSSSGNVIPSLQNDSLYLTGLANFNGTVTIYVGATDGSLSVADTFLVHVAAQNDAASSFALLIPAHNTLTNILRPAFRWNASSDIDGDTVYYLLEISTLQNFSSIFQSYTIIDTFQTLTSDLDSLRIYYWRVTADDHKGGAFQSSSFTLNVDAKRPNVHISLLQGTITKRYLDAYAYADEDLSGAVNSTFTLKNSSGTTIDSRSAAMSKIGPSNLYTSSYHLTNVGSLEVQVTAQDAAANQRIATRNYTVSALLKGETFVSLSPEFEVSSIKPALSESGFLLTGSITEIESTLMPSMNAGVELIGTTELKDALKLTIRYDASEMSSLMLRSDFDERKIGVYRVTEFGFEYAGGQGRLFSVSTTVNSFGKYVALYDQNHAVIPEKIELSQNYPNPFNPTTTIQYGLAATGRVKLLIYNILGQRIRELVDANQPAGYYKILWDGRNAAGQIVATGIYFYRLETPTGVLSRKMLLIK